jgi:hypothetical protein
MNGSKMQKFIELWTNKKQTGDSALVQSKGTKTIYINSIRIIMLMTYLQYVSKNSIVLKFRVETDYTK